MDVIISRPHRRYNPLSGEWILVSPHRTQRPWQGKVETAAGLSAVRYDPQCYLCPGNARAGGAQTPPYTSTFVFDNDYAALLPHAGNGTLREHDLLLAESERGICRVVCFSPRHDLTMALMSQKEISQVIDVWVEQYAQLASRDFINYVQIFENRGEIMGCSNPHPHGQIWANETVPLFPTREGDCQEEYRRSKNACLLCDYLRIEMDKKERIVFTNDSWAVLVPFWAFWPFEALVLPTEHVGDLTQLTPKQCADLAQAMQRLCIRYDNLFATSFPYSMGIHQRPCDGRPHEQWHLHLHYYPPLLRSATVRKFMVGYEMLAQPQRDITAESSADRLRSCADRHYSEAS